MKEINLGNNLVELYDQPIQGRLFVVGDLHGCYTLLMNKLDELKFGGVLKSMLTLNEAIIDVKEG